MEQPRNEFIIDILDDIFIAIEPMQFPRLPPYFGVFCKREEHRIILFRDILPMNFVNGIYAEKLATLVAKAIKPIVNQEIRPFIWGVIYNKIQEKENEFYAAQGWLLPGR